MSKANVKKKLTVVTPMPLVTIPTVVTIVHVTTDGKVMVSPVSILMNVLLVLMIVTNSAFVPIPQAHTTAHVMMDIWVMDFCALFPVQHSTTPHQMVSFTITARSQLVHLMSRIWILLQPIHPKQMTTTGNQALDSITRHRLSLFNQNVN